MPINQREGNLDGTGIGGTGILSKTKNALAGAAMMALSSVGITDEGKQIELPESVGQKVESLLANPYGMTMNVGSEKGTYFLERVGNSVKVTTPKKEVFFIGEPDNIIAPSFISGETQTNTVSITPNPTGLGATYNGGDTVISGKASYSKLNGATVEGQFATKLSDNVAGAIALEGGENLQRVLGTLGFRFNNSVLTVTGEGLYGKQKFSFTSGEVEEKVKQNKLGVALKIKLDSSLIDSLIVSGSITKADSKNLQNKEVIIDNETLFAIMDNYRRIAGGTLIEGSLGGIFKLSPDTNLQLSLKYESLKWDDRYTYMADKSGLGVEAKLSHKFTPATSGYVAAKTSQTGNNYSVGADTSNDDGWKFGVEYRYTDGQNGLKDDRYVGITASKSFGGPDLQNIPNGKTYGNNPTNYYNLVQETINAINRTKTMGSTLHRVDQKTVSILEIYKAGLDDGVDIAIDGTLVVVGISSIENITKNGMNFTSNGQFSVSNNSLYINSRSFPQPPVGVTDTYVVRGRDLNGFFVDVTISVEKGSIKITGVQVEQVANEPGTIGVPTLDIKTHNSINTTPGTTNGMTNVRVALYSNSDLSDAHKIAENTSGDFTGLTDSTTYYVVTIGDDYNESNGVTETKVSTTLVVTTDAPPNLPGTINVPTLESKGETYINVTPGSTSGMTNIRVRMYANSGLTILLAENTSGDFVGLANGSTYYFVTVGDDYNENTKTTETKKSTALSVTTDTPSPVDVLPTSNFASSSVTKLTTDGVFTNTFTTNSSGTITYSSSNTAVATVNASTGAVTIVGAGSATITANQASAPGFTSDSDSYSLTVNTPSPVDVLPTSNFASSSVTKLTTDGVFTNTFTTNSSGTITYSSSNTAVATVNASTGAVTIVGAGSATITANQASAPGFTSDSDSYSLTVNTPPPSNTPPIISNITSSGSISLDGEITNIGLSITDDDLSKVSWSLSVTGGTGTFSQSSGIGNTLNGITFDASGGGGGWTIQATISDIGSGDEQIVTIYSN